VIEWWWFLNFAIGVLILSVVVALGAFAIIADATASERPMPKAALRTLWVTLCIAATSGVYVNAASHAVTQQEIENPCSGGKP
jgi:hypothetical protein